MSTLEIQNSEKVLNKKRSLAQLVNIVAEILKKRKRMSIAELSVMLGYSLEYFRKSILPQLSILNKCIVRTNNEVEWECNEGEE